MLLHTKVRSDLLSYFIHMTHDMGPYFCTKNDFEEKKVNERFGEF